MIKSLGLVLAYLCMAAVPGSTAQPETSPALGWHFTGLDALERDGGETALKAIGDAAASRPLANQIRSRLTQHLPGWFGLSSTHLSAEIVAPLVADLLARESAARFEGASVTGADWLLAVKLEPADTERWNSALLTIGRRLGLGEPAPLKLDGLSGWRIPGKAGQRGYAFLTHQGWVLMAGEFKEASTARAWAAALAKDGRPVARLADEWLRCDVRPAAFDWQPSLPFAGKVAQVTAGFSRQGKDVRTTAKLALIQPVSLSDATWQIPKGLALDPLVSFTAVRNLKHFFGGLAPMKGLSAGLIPDQWYGWSRGNVGFIDDFAVPVADAGQVFAHLERSIPATYNPRLLELALGQWLTATNNTRLLWRGLPVFVPYVGPKQDGEQPFLYGGIFPLTEQTNAIPAPAELFAQFETRKDLVYYDWEITAARIAAYEQASPFAALFLPAAKAQDGTHGAAWLKEFQAKLIELENRDREAKNVITEISMSGERELSVTRRSQVGLTGIELWLFTRWLDSTEFPQFPYSQPRKPEPGKRPAASPGDGLPGQP